MPIYEYSINCVTSCLGQTPSVPALVHHVEPPVEGDGPGVAEGLVEGRAEGPQRLVLRGRVQVQRRADHVQVLSRTMFVTDFYRFGTEYWCNRD